MKISVDFDRSVVLLVSTDFCIELRFCLDDLNPTIPLYCVNDVERFFVSYFEIDYTIKTERLQPGMFKVMSDGSIFVTEVGLKYVFSLIIAGHISFSNQLKERPFSRFFNFFLSPDCQISNTVLKKKAM